MSLQDLAARLRQLDARLGALDLAALRASVLREVGIRLRQRVTEGLSEPPGGPHQEPWRRSGALAASIVAVADDTSLRLGSTDPVGRYQELGTSRVPPRPFLAPVAATIATEAGDPLGSAMTEALREAVR
jgi:hypothetical protein